MAVEQTLAIVKPDGVRAQLVGEVIGRFERAGLCLVGARMLRFSADAARGFYAVHRERPFFEELVEFMISGPVVVMAIEGEGAIGRVREIMGATDPAKAAPNTIRRDFGTSIQENIVHGSDGPDTARFEIDYFFKPDGLCR